jgi:hypothetical protein
MLFDIQGKRRRVVQATYLTLAVLMGGGLVLFGIGSDAGTGGLFDALSGGSGGGSNDFVEDRIDRNESKVEANRRAEAPRKELVRDYYSLAASQATADNTFPGGAQDELRTAAVHWDAYLDVEKGKPDASLARVALQLFDVNALNQPEQALRAARIIAEDGNDAGSYLLLMQYASLANDKRTKKLATQKAIELAPKNQRGAVREQIKQLEAQRIAQQIQARDAKPVPGQTDPTNVGSGGK